MLEHAGAYATFANRGSHLTPSAILSVTDPSGDVLYEWKPNPEQVIKQDVADTITSVLQDDDARAYAFGRGGILTLPERAVAAKTGTTNNYKDAWTIGYTPSLVTAVWAGRTDNKSMNPGFGGSRVAGPIWNEFMRRALENSPAESFPEPPPNDAEKPVLRGSQGGNITLAINRVTGKRATSSTPEQYVVMRSYIQPHSILHYVDPQDPRGAAPSNPAANPQYQAWEAAISDWIARRKAEDENWEVSFEAPPADFDDAYSLEMIPSLTVVSPQPSSTIFADRLITDIRASAPRGVQRVIYTIDGRLVSIERSHPFNLDTSLERFEEGPHILSVTVEDDIGNRLEEVIPFILERKNFFGEISEILSTSSTPLSTDEEDESEQ
jgi:penicillin-binding protein 1A